MTSISEPASTAVEARFSPGAKVGVLLPLALPGALDYLVPEGAALAPGDFVEVPIAKRRAVGVVWREGSDKVAAARCKAIVAKLDIPPLPPQLRRLITWTSAYTLAPEGMVLKMAMSVPSALAPKTMRPAFVAAPDLPPGLKLTEARKKVLEIALVPMAPADIARAAGVGVGVVKGLVDAGALIAEPLVRTRLEADPDWSRSGPVLSPDQDKAARQLKDALTVGFSVHLLEGVTGSGKTEVYFEAIAAALEQGRQVLVMLPEIALSAQWLERFKGRFGAKPLEWHSELGDAYRRDVWRSVAEGGAKVVVGARSALFLPFANLGLIVVDEEHDASFKQDEGVIYNARDMAVVRARLSSIPVVLASATPSLETRVNAEAGRYRHLMLKDRHGGATLPDVTVVDLRREPPARRSWLSPQLIKAVEETLAAKEQAMLFLNRRGYAPLTLCRCCGYRLQCPHCTAWLVEHRHNGGSGRLECHHCGHSMTLPPVCPSCGAESDFVACGPGVERLAEEAQARFPHARLAVMASDTLSGPAAAARLVENMARGEIDLLIGTQVVAKGHHFPLLTLVGVVDADLGLTGGDLRAAERTFQLLSQVSGRAGRADRPGRVLLQTYQPDHKVIAALASGDAAAFYAEETEQRRIAGMPPFGRLAALILSGADEGRVDAVAANLARVAPRLDGIDILGPAIAPLAVLRGRHRRRFLIKARRDIPIQSILGKWLAPFRTEQAVRIQIDIDPYAFF